MKEPRESPSRAVMSGHGFYNDHSLDQAAAAEYGINTLCLAAASVPIIAPEGPLTLVDYGCSQGKNSIRPVSAALAELRLRTAAAVNVVHNDLPDNDFDSLFKALAKDKNSYANIDSNTHTLCSANSFYKEVAPRSSVSLGWSAICTHWLSRLPSEVPDHIAPFASGNSAIRRQFVDRARSDWDDFLNSRAKELLPGGRLVMVQICAHQSGLAGTESIVNVMQQAMSDLVAQEKLCAASAKNVTLPLWIRTAEEYITPIKENPQFELEKVQVVKDIESPLWKKFRSDGDARAYVEASVNSLRAWSSTILAEAFGENDVLEEFYKLCFGIGMAAPSRFNHEAYCILLDIRRI